MKNIPITNNELVALSDGTNSSTARYIFKNGADGKEPTSRAQAGVLTSFVKRNGKGTADQVNVKIEIPVALYQEKGSNEKVLATVFVAVPDKISNTERENIAIQLVDAIYEVVSISIKTGRTYFNPAK